ncbi:MAG: transposase [Clostridia bacterium]|nr:transposase [Clostridia bacterium]
MEKLPSRKLNRLADFDYSLPGTYFVTICAKERKNMFWQTEFFADFLHSAGFFEYGYCVDSVGATIGRPQGIKLSNCGQAVEESLCNISAKYEGVFVDYYVIMPDHIHLLLRTGTDKNGRPLVAPTLSRIVKQFKGSVTKRVGVSIWQKLFFDHVVRNEQDYLEHVKYILENPITWRNKQDMM